MLIDSMIINNDDFLSKQIVVNAFTFQSQQKTMARKSAGPLVHAQVQEPIKIAKRIRSLVV